MVVPVAVFLLACPAGSGEYAVAEEQAIEIARQALSFEPDTTEATRVTSEGKVVWRIVFTGRLPGQPPGLFETVVVEVDASSGEVVRLART